MLHPEKESLMNAEMHCSACDALVPLGSNHCPGCGLQLMAQAVPAVYVEGPRWPQWQIVLVAVVAFIVACQFFK